MKLSELQTGQSGTIIKVHGHGGFRKRIMEMGFVRGKQVEVLLNAPLKDPIKYKLLDYEVSLRRSEAAMIEVITQQEAEQFIEHEWGVSPEEGDAHVQNVISSMGKCIDIALVGNPNCGKSSLYNALSGGHEHVGNYSGVTVEAKRGTFEYKDYKFVIYDLPGTYALSAYSPEESFVRRQLIENPPDVIVNVAAASNLERNLFLTTELIDINQSMVVALNMYDELQHSGAKLDYNQLGAMLGVPMVPVVARTGKGLDALLDTVIEVYEGRNKTVRHIHINHSPAIEEGIQALSAAMKNAPESLPKQFSFRYLAIKLLEGDKEIEKLLEGCSDFEKWLALRDSMVSKIKSRMGDDVETLITDEKYGFISGALKETFTPSAVEQRSITSAIDAMVTHKLWGFPIFLLLMWLMFEVTFKLGDYPMGWIEAGVEALGSLVGNTMPDGALKDLIVDGIIGGVGGVIVFLPNILILFLCISFMEDSGYMARAAFIMDKIMHCIGLHGKSFIPLIMGFGCNVPAIMASRTIESRSSRIITVLISPFMSCSARLPVYILMAGVFFPAHAGAVLFGLYALGIAVAALTALILRKGVFGKDETPFVMELPPYRMPTMKTTLRHMWEKGEEYLKKMGGVILVASIIVWALTYYPRQGEDVSPEIQQEQSYLGRIGKLCEPVMSPTGIGWKGSIAILAGVGAKEITVSTLGVLYSEGSAEPESNLGAKLVQPDPQTGAVEWTPLSALSFMVFILLYFPCIASLAAIARETGSWRWALFSALYNTLFAWVAAAIVYNIGNLII